MGKDATIISGSIGSIGKDTMVGPNCVITDSDFHAHWPAETRHIEPAFALDRGVSIGANVWLGMNSLILKGGTIGDGEMGIRDSFWAISNRSAEEKEKLKHTPKELADIDSTLADIYYGNFSVFQSLPDAWAIDQLFPVMPVHRLTEFPSRKAVISDITCDSDGRIDKFIDPQGMRTSLDLHPLVDGDEYYLGVFLVGAYQETLGDLHNLLGDTNVVSIRISEEMCIRDRPGAVRPPA